VIIDLRPPHGAGELSIGASGPDIVEALQRLGDPEVLRRTRQDHPGWCVRRDSGLFIATYFDGDDRVNAIEFGRPEDPSDVITYLGLDLFATPAADLLEQLREHTALDEGEDGYALTAPDLLLAFWRPTVPESPDDPEGRFFESVLIAHPGYYADRQQVAPPGE
jgi:hypothetical protein